MDDCYGCGKPVDPHAARNQKGGAGYYWMGGETRTFCGGRYDLPKVGCLNKAVARMVEGRACPLCGEDATFSPGRGRPCPECREIIELGRKTQESTDRLQTVIISKILASFMTLPSFGSGGNVAWPFIIAVRKGEKDYRLSEELRRTLVALWEHWGELHRAKGLVEGSNLLARLHAGETSLLEYEEAREKAVERISTLDEKLQKMIAKIVDGTKAVADWNERVAREDDLEVLEASPTGKSTLR